MAYKVIGAEAESEERHSRGVPLLLLLTVLPAFAQAPAQPSIPTGPRFWTSTGSFVGSSRCADCHVDEATKYRQSNMSRALQPVASCPILQGDIHYSFKSGEYTYSITREATKVIYSVSNGREHIAIPLEFAFGGGKAGQTYVYSLNGTYYESRVSYYSELKNLDLTVGAINSKPSDLISAAGRIMQGNEARDCFGCHTTGARVAGTLQLKNYEPGVQCESCHGPGGDHVAAMLAGKPVAGTIRNLSGMDPDTSNAFCGTCHRTWQTVTLMGIRGINTARFPAYRLTSSPCFSLDDSRISCTTCHDPHGGLVSNDKFYDSKCTACHNTDAKSAGKKVCPVAKESCTSCHVQKVVTPEAHHAFPDHWFRIVRSKDDYPE